MKFDFEDIKFFQKDKYIEGIFLKIYSLKLEGIEKLGKYNIKNGVLEIEMSEKKLNKFYNLLDKGFMNLTNKLNNKKTIYIHKNSRIPLIGSVSFGIVDRGSNLIEIKPITSCNLNCIYCSINQDKRPVDVVIEADYMVEELNKLIEFKECDQIEIHIGCNGEPLRYASLIYLVKKIRKNKNVKKVSMDTNATMLTKNKIDELVKAGMTRFNISLDALNQDLAQEIAGCPYNLKHVLNMIDYISKTDAELLIAPVWVPNVNDGEIEKIIKKYYKIANMIGIQKYLKYKLGRIQKEISWNKFFKKLKELEKKYNTKLILDETSFDIIKTKKLPKTFEINQIIDAEIISENNVEGSKIAVTNNRTIAVNTNKTGKVKIKITKNKHNIFFGELVN